ncbi:MAG: DUF86 domain-containing protein [Patescibacteria group bacterium]|nr:DUF86 domain-containing protein [Patescibacteria group bacterium]
MKRDRSLYCEDILNAIETIGLYIKGINFVEFSKNILIQDGVIRRFIVIGEALAKLKYNTAEDDPDLPLIQAISMRNFLVHEYYSVDLDIVWKTAKEDLEELEEKIKKLLETY